ncbi:MAG: peptidylprolyl isomerase, partial [Phycisphaerales bacterium JB041]
RVGLDAGMKPRTTVAGRCFLIGLVLATGCNNGGSTTTSAFDGLDRADRYASGGGRYVPRAGAPLSIDGQPVEWAAVSDRLAEAAGAVVVEEIALDRVILREAASRGIQITQADLDREREWLARAVEQGARATGTDPAALVREIRQRRGLGPERFEALLRRNAALRAMVRGSVEITDAQVERAWRTQHGERVRVRIIIAPSMTDAQRLRTQALAAGGNEYTFAKLAETYSTDNSAPLGGLIEPFSTEDPAYEENLRRVAAGLQPGEIGPVVATRNGHAVVLLTGRIPPDGVTLEQARERLREQITLRQERISMDQLANQLLSSAHVRVLDPALSWSVEAGRGK